MAVNGPIGKRLQTDVVQYEERLWSNKLATGIGLIWKCLFKFLQFVSWCLLPLFPIMFVVNAVSKSDETFPT